MKPPVSLAETDPVIIILAHIENKHIKFVIIVR